MNKEKLDKNLLTIELLIGIPTIIIYLIIITLLSFLNIEESMLLIITILLTIHLIIVALALLKIEQISGFFECGKCKHKHNPTYLKILLAMHIGRTRYMMCPKCQKKSWNRKVIK